MQGMGGGILTIIFMHKIPFAGRLASKPLLFSCFVNLRSKFKGNVRAFLSNLPLYSRQYNASELLPFQKRAQSPEVKRTKKKHPLTPAAGVAENTVYFVEVGVGEWNE